MPKEPGKMTDISRRALDAILENPELSILYRKATRNYAEGELRAEVMKMADDAMQDEELKTEVFSSNDSMFSLFCGIWIHFLLTEIAGIKKDKLRAMVSKIFIEDREDKPLH